MALSVEHFDNTLTVKDGDEELGRFPAIWLRDNVPSGRHRAQGQRTFDINELDPPTICRVTLEDDAVLVEFGDLSDRFPLGWLLSFAKSSVAGGRVLPLPTHWDASYQTQLGFADFNICAMSPRSDWAGCGT